MNEATIRYICTSCGYIYDPDQGDPGSGAGQGTLFAALPADWVCPVCYASKEAFDPLD